MGLRQLIPFALGLVLTLSSPAIGAEPASSVELTFWQSIMYSLNADEYREYLRQFPKGSFAGLAQIRIAEIGRMQAQQMYGQGAGTPSHEELRKQRLVPTMSDKDYLAAEIMRCWNFDPGATDAGNMIVQVHILIQPDGTVTDASLKVDQTRYANDSFYRAAANSARRAPLACSPLRPPPGQPDFFKTYSDFTLNFDPRSLVR